MKRLYRFRAQTGGDKTQLQRDVDREAQKIRRALRSGNATDCRKEPAADAMLVLEYLRAQRRQQGQSQGAALAFFGAPKNCSPIERRSSVSR